MDDVKKLIFGVIAGTIETLMVKLIETSTDITTCFLIFVFGSIFSIILLNIIHRRKDIIIILTNHFKTKVKLKHVEGFFRRDEKIEEIIEWHRSAKGCKIGMVYGFGGSGKTKLAREFGSASSSYCYSIFVGSERELPDIQEVKNHTIIFIDYIYEYIKEQNELQKLQRFISACKNSKNNISIIFLERTNLIEYVLYALELDRISTKRINLNEEGVNNRELLEDIFKYRLPEKDNHQIESYVKLIEEKLDKKYCRPIFAHIMSELLINKPDIKFDSFEGQNGLFEEYWKYRTKRKNFDSFLQQVVGDGYTEEVNRLKTILFNKTETLLLFTILTSLVITIDDSGDKRKIIIKRKNGQLYDNENLVKLIREILFLNSQFEIRSMMLAQLFPAEDGSMELNKVTISMDTYDIISAWLLTHFLNRSENEGDILVDLILCVHEDMGNTVLSFVTRATEGDQGGTLLWWQKNFLLKSFKNWNETGYEEWLKNCFELYSKSNNDVKDSIFYILKQFFGELNCKEEQLNKVIRYVEWLWNYFKTVNVTEIDELVDRLDIKKSTEDNGRALSVTK